MVARRREGQPIISFRKQCDSLLKECELHMPKVTLQSHKLLPSCLRSFFPKTRLQKGDMRIEDLGKASGTSKYVLERDYYGYDMRRAHDGLIA